MSKDQLEVISAQQATRIDLIKGYHSAFASAFGDQMGYACLAGRELCAAKDELPHGSFIQWRERYLPEISHSATQRYMKFFSEVQAKLPTVGNFKLLANGALPAEEKETVLKFVHDHFDGKSLTEAYRDLGVIRQPKKPQHHPVKLTAEQQLQADLNAAEALLHDACSAISLLRENHHQAITKAKPDTRRKLMEHALWLTATLRKFNKGRKPRK